MGVLVIPNNIYSWNSIPRYPLTLLTYLFSHPFSCLGDIWPTVQLSEYFINSKGSYLNRKYIQYCGRNNAVEPKGAYEKKYILAFLVSTRVNISDFHYEVYCCYWYNLIKKIIDLFPMLFSNSPSSMCHQKIRDLRSCPILTMSLLSDFLSLPG